MKIKRAAVPRGSCRYSGRTSRTRRGTSPAQVHARTATHRQNSGSHLNNRLCNTRSQSDSLHSPRAFSLSTLQEYLHERSHSIVVARAATVHAGSNCSDEQEMRGELARPVHLPDKENDSLPLLPVNPPLRHTQKPWESVTLECNDSTWKCNERSGNHQSKYVFCVHEESACEEEHLTNRSDAENEAPSINGYRICAPLHSFNSVASKCNKNKMMAELAGRSFACGNFYASKRRSRTRHLRQAGTRAVAPKPKKGSQWDTFSSSYDSESAPFLSESEISGAYRRDNACYPGCKSLPRLMREKLHLVSDADMEAVGICGSKSRKGVMQQTSKQVSKKKERKSNALFSDTNPDEFVKCTMSETGRGNIVVSEDSDSIIIKGQEQHRSLSEKHRPLSFGDVVGQSMISQALSNTVFKGKIAPVYLFQGPSGTGKTCTAKIFAASINCLSRYNASEGIIPCQSCDSCKSLFGTKSSCLRIVDANSGIKNNMKSLSRFITSAGSPLNKYKVLIIDECHMLSKEAWSLFLSIIDQLLKHVVFILITTDADQLPRSVISKCQRFTFTKIKDVDILSRLCRLCDLEGIEAEADALQLIASRADGSLFDAEATLDQLASFGQRVTSNLVREMIGLVSDEKLVELLEGALKGDSVSTVRCIRQLMEAGTEPLALMSQLATLITDLLAGHTPPLPSSTFISQTLTKVELEKLRQALRILSEAEKQLRSCNNKTTWLTAALLQFSPPESLSHPDSYVQHAARSPSLGTSLTQSPNALLETSEKETADLFLHGANSGSSKPLWRSSHPYEGWHNDVDEAGHESQPVLYPSTVEQAESLEDADIQINAQDKENGLDRPMKQAFSGFNTCYPSPARQHRDTTMQYRSSVQDIPVCGKKKCSEYHNCNEGVTGTSLSSAEKVWKKLLDGNGRLNILSTQGKLISLSVSEAYAIVHLEFQFPEDMRSARKAILSISEAFGRALGCPVDIRLSLAPSQEKMDDSFITGINGFYDGPFGCKQVMQRRSRRKKPRKRRLSKMNCAQGGLSVNYYSHPQICCNSSSYYRFHENSLMDKRNILRSSSSDEDFTPWNQVAELNRSLTRPAHILQKLSPSSTRAISEDYPEYRMNEIAHEKCIQCGFSDSLDEKNNHCESVPNSSRELFHSLRVEKDSLNHSPQSSEDDLEYDQTNMTPSFRTGLLCWKMVGRKSTDKAKGCCQRTTGCVSCAQTD